MRHSKVEIYLHLVWATMKREPILTPELSRPIYRCIQAEAVEMKCVVLALNGMPDHVHLLVRVPSTVCAADLANKVKGVASRFANDQLTMPHLFRWQEGYGAFSVSRSHVNRVIAYIQNQNQHHAAGTIWPEWEETFEDSDSLPPAATARRAIGRRASKPSPFHGRALPRDG